MANRGESSENSEFNDDFETVILLLICELSLFLRTLLLLKSIFLFTVTQIFFIECYLLNKKQMLK